MKKFFIYTICLFSLFLCNNVKAYDINNVNLSGISSLQGYNGYYALAYSQYNNKLYLLFKSNYYGAMFMEAVTDPSYAGGAYYNDICASEGGCFTRLNSNKYNSSWDSPGYYESSDNGNTWVQKCTYCYSTDPIINPIMLKTTVDVYGYYSGTTTTRYYSMGYEYSARMFNIAFEQGPVIIKDSAGATANLVTYYLEPLFSDFVPNNFVFSYVENTTGGGFRDSYIFSLNYSETGISYNGNTYHYYFNLPLNYNTGVTFSIYDLEDNLLQEDYVNAYLSTLTDLSGYTMYDFRNYEYANMSNINNGSFGLSNQLNSNVTINAINYNTGTSIDFLTSNYLVSSHIDNTGVVWYDFNFNNEPIYLQFINNFNNSTDFYTFIDTYNLYLYFDNTSYVHLSGSPNSLESQQQEVNQQSYKDSQGNIIYEENPIVIGLEDSTEFFENLKRYFDDFDTDTFGLTGIITSPLHLIQNLLSNSCSSLSLPLPYINSSLTLPCMSSIYSQYFGGFLTLYQGITFGLVAYWVTIRILNLVKDFRNPDHDEIEVLDL